MQTESISRDVKPVPTIAPILEVLGILLLVAAGLVPVIVLSNNPAYPTPENPALSIPWSTVASCGLGGLVLLAFGGILRGLHKIEQAISSKN